MAPEVLEGAISFDQEAFQRIDMYAVSLVLWEMVTRTAECDPFPKCKMPFEDQVRIGVIWVENIGQKNTQTTNHTCTYTSEVIAAPTRRSIKNESSNYCAPTRASVFVHSVGSVRQIG